MSRGARPLPTLSDVGDGYLPTEVEAEFNTASDGHEAWSRGLRLTFAEEVRRYSAGNLTASGVPPMLIATESLTRLDKLRLIEQFWEELSPDP